jgi:uncharacterized protein (TIGR00730 family)
MAIGSVCVYCASSTQVRAPLLAAAREMGASAAARGWTVVYGGGRVGLMGELAAGALAAGGRVVGVIPQFMQEREWAHDGLSRLEVVPDMHTRKARMIQLADALVALPGGCGTLDELLEAITWRRLQIHKKPIVIANVEAFYAPLLQQLELCVAERMLGAHEIGLWHAADSIAAVIENLAQLRGAGLGDDGWRLV